MCRYLLHPPLSHDRLSFAEDGRIRLEFTRPWRNGVDALHLDSLNFIARLIPLVPKPGTHQLRYHGVLAARSDLRQSVIPSRPPDGAQLELFKRNGKPARRCGSTSSSLPKLHRIAWARLLKRMGGYEMETCPDCGAQLRIVSAVIEPHEIQRALQSRGLLDPISPLRLSPARGPPSPQLAFEFVFAAPAELVEGAEQDHEAA